MKTVILWCLTAFFIISCIAFFPSVASVLFLILAVILIPINKISNFFNRIIPNRKVKITGIIVIAIVGMVISPTTPTPTLQNSQNFEDISSKNENQGNISVDLISDNTNHNIIDPNKEISPIEHDEDEYTEKTNNSPSNIVSSFEEKTVENTVTETIKDTIVYVSDKTVNKFITEFNSMSKHEISNIENGNIKTKFLCNANDCHLEILNTTDTEAKCFSISVTGGCEITARDKMLEVVTDIILILDPTISDSTIEETIKFLKNTSHMISDYSINNNVIIETYVPIIELSWGTSDCRVDIISKNYKN